MNKVPEARVDALPPLEGKDVLEAGCGTAYVSSWLARRGARPTGIDVSEEQLATARRFQQEFGLEFPLVHGSAEQLPFEDESFDLVLGHAVLHHIPDLRQAFAEMRRVLRPGGTILFAGEPSVRGDRLAAIPKRAGLRAAPLWRRLMRAAPAPHHDAQPGEGESLEPFVDVHAFLPEDLQRAAASAGLTDIRVQGEELLANWFGWFNRTVEATAEPASIPWLWRQYAFRGYLALQAVDRVLLEPRLPAGIFYNLLLTARR
jgi:SAM-dependent methyltransferase